MLRSANKYFKVLCAQLFVILFIILAWHEVIIDFSSIRLFAAVLGTLCFAFGEYKKVLIPLRNKE